MTRYLSNKFRVLSAFSIILVVYIHMYYAEGESMDSLNIVEKFMGGGICSVAVPLFYAISGYLFFIKVPDGINSIKQKIGKRCRTLLVPYLIANIFTFLFYVSLNLVALKMPTISDVVNFKILDVIQRDGLWNTLELVFINPPIAFQLWFVRDLMVMVLFSPLIWIVLRKIASIKAGKWLYLILFTVSFFSKFGAFTFFSAGGFLALSNINLLDKPGSRSVGMLLTAVYIALCALSACGIVNSVATSIIPLVGIPAIWMMYDVLVKGIESNRVINWLAKYTFFIYLIHEPFLNIFKKLPLLIDRSEPTLILCYLIIPPIFCGCAAYVGMCLKKIIPSAYSVYTGGR